LNDGNNIQREISAMTGQSTVPNVFVKGKHLGGNDDTHAALASGKLQAMLSAL
jgi:glutaredoxin 3